MSLVTGLRRLCAVRALCAVGFLLSTVTVSAQTGSVVADALPALGETNSAPPKRAWNVTPNVTLEKTYTDNVRLQPVGSSDVVTRLVPSVRIDGQSARAKGNIDFRIQQIKYDNSPDRDRTQRYLNGQGTLELADKWLYLDLSSNIARSAVSAFAPSSTGTESINANVVETKTYRVSPYVRGHLGNFADYLVRLDSTRISSASSTMPSINTQGMQFDLSGKTGFTRIAWQVNGDAQQTTLSNGTNNQNSAMRATLFYNVTPQLKLSLIGGEEAQDFANFTKKTSSITGAGIDWAPSERTAISYKREERYFGTGHNLNLTHRTARTAWRISDSRDVQIRPPQMVTYSTGTYYNLFYDMYESTIPDPIARARFVESLMQQLQIPLNAQVVGGSLTSRASINRAQEVSFTLSGIRNTVTTSVQRSNRSVLASGIDVVDDFSQSSTVMQQGLNFNWSYRLTQNTSLAFMFANMRSSGGGNTALKLNRDTTSLMLNSKLGSYTSGGFGLRRTEGSGSAQYVENALVGSLVMSF